MAVSVLSGPAQQTGFSKSVAGNSNVQLFGDEARHGTLTFTGALTGNISVTLPVSALNVGQQWRVLNNTSGAFTLTVKGATGSGVVVIQGSQADLRWTGSDFEDVGGGTYSSPVVLTAEAAAQVPLTINAHASQSGNLLLIQEADGDDKLRVTADGGIQMLMLGGQSESGIQTKGINVWGGDPAVTRFINVRHVNDAGVAMIHLSGDGAGSGELLFGCSQNVSVSSIIRNKIGIRAATSTPIFFYTNTAGQPIQFYAGGTTESARFEDGRFRLGGTLTTNLAKLQVVGQADEAQLFIRAHSSQTADLITMDESGGADRILVDSSYRLRIAATSGETLTGLTGALYIRANVDNQTTAEVMVENRSDTSAAAAKVTVKSTCTGGLIAWPATFASAALRDYVGLQAANDAAGLIFYLDNTGQQWRFNAAGGNVLQISGGGVWTLLDDTRLVAGSTTGLRLGTVGGAADQKIGAFGATPIVQPVLATGAGATVDNVITVLQNLGWVRQS